MNHPEFFDRIPPLTLFDPLADFLGAFENGRVDIHFIDVVRLAGHSCPTIAGSWLMAREALKTLYPDAIPERGNIEVAMRGAKSEGVNGVMANVFALITGATEEGGFHGLAGQFDRRHLLSFGNRIDGTVRFTRRDSGASVAVSFDASRVPSHPATGELMALMISGEATVEQKKMFQQAWQKRVESIMLYADHRHPLVKILS